MANHKSAKKCIRQTVRRTEVNRQRVSRVRTFVKKAECDLGMHQAASTATQETAMVSIVAAERELMRAARKGVVHKKAASRKISRLVKRAKAMGASA
ncbi:MAG: 30S ribosomal protein S20 [Proteobacteria bacterium]|nr:30S ribosomal protein S20 [Pseudomonadota bacterium]